jgi:hypothetical protein
MAQNAYLTNTPALVYKNTGYATYYGQTSGQHQWFTAPSGTAGNAITFTQAMTLDASATLNIDGGTGKGRITLENGSSVNTIYATTTAFGAYNTLNLAASAYTFKLSNSTQAMTLDASGNLLIGQTVVGETNANGFWTYPTGGKFGQNHVNGTSSGAAYAQWAYNGSIIGSITQSGTTAVLYNTTSDQRLKENIVDAAPASALIDSIQVRQYDWKSDGSFQRYGFVAQELVTVAPEAVHQPADPEEMMAVDYSKLVPMLVKEIQSLRKRLAAAGI